MTFPDYKTGGPITEGESKFYIIRDADQEIIRNLQSMNYVLIIEPRQQGKTSLINHLIYQGVFPNYIYVYIDVSSCNHSSEEGWYESLCERIIHQLKSRYKIVLDLIVPKTAAQWRNFLSSLVLLIAENKKKIVIILDEIGNANFPGASDFFIVLRDIYNSRQIEEEFREISFVLMGAFHPRNLISDDSISPFNIAQQISLVDFTLDQIIHLLSQTFDKGDELNQAAEKILFWTNGQPYLTQLMCSYINHNKITAEKIDRFPNYVLKEEKNHIPSLVTRLNHSDSLLGYANKILGGEKIKFFPGVNPIQEELRLLGLLRDDDQGFCCLRNRIYQLALKSNIQINFDVFICHNTIDKPEIKRISNRLKNNKIMPWLDEWELPPGLPWQRLLEAQIEQIKSVAVFVGENGIGPWQQMEIEAFLREFVKRGCPVIPVLLPSAPNKPDLPVFLSGMNWVNFKQKSPNPLKQLIWGITGKKTVK